MKSNPSLPAISARDRSTTGFTLFEVGLSLLLVAFGVISVLALFPMGIKAQQMSRFQVYAAAKAIEMVESFNAMHNSNPAIDFEAPRPWDVHISYKGYAHDLESRVCNYRSGLFPLPLDIARRIESDDDQIQDILNKGGYVYYSQPLATTGMMESGFTAAPGSAAAPNPPNEAQKLVIGIVGYPQNNAIHTWPQKAWPYYTPYPSPPIHIRHANDGLSGAYLVDWSGTVGGNTANSYLWEDLNLGNLNNLGNTIAPPDAALRTLFQAYEAYQILPAVVPPALPDAMKAQDYLDKAVAWCVSRGIPPTAYDGSTALTNFPSTTDRHLQVLASRFVAHAAICKIQSGAGASGSVIVNDTTIKQMHENCLFLATRFQACYPYDWGAPRPLQRAIMMDFPLMEYDLRGTATTMLKGTIFGSTEGSEQWQVATPYGKPTNIGISLTYPNASLYGPSSPNNPAFPFEAAQWAPKDHSTLLARFSPSDRCRQIVVWAVDWQSYIDFETAPSAPVDISRYMKTAPFLGSSFNALCGGQTWLDHHTFGFRNPEKMIVFNGDMTGFPTGTATPPAKGTVPGVHGTDNFGANTNDQGLGATQWQIFSGVWGADRNSNQRLDRGTVPASVRLRAVTVARFNYYDPRVPLVIR
jgi:hypothetical protein